MVGNQLVCIGDIETSVFYDLQFLVDENMPEVLIRPKRNERKNLMARKDDLSLVEWVLEELGEFPRY